MSMVCKYCSLPVTPVDYFCPNCGKKLKDKPVSTGFGALVWLFGLSAFAPPFGIGLTIKYMKSEDEQARALGWVSLIVTIVALILTILLTKSLMDNLNQKINTEMQKYQF